MIQCSSIAAPGSEVQALVRRAAAGEERAWTLLVDRFGPTVRSVARRYGLNHDDREDVAQRTWLALVRHIDRLCGHPAVAGWVVTTARHECLKVLAASGRELPLEDPLAGREPHGGSAHDHVFEAERRQALHEALGDMPEHQQRVMWALLLEPSYDEVSSWLGIPKGSIGPTRGRSLERLRNDPRLVAAVG